MYCLLEPVGSKAPAFAGDQKLSLLVRRANTDVSLPCNAQGHPTPVYRYEETGPLGIEGNEYLSFPPLLSSVKIVEKRGTLSEGWEILTAFPSYLLTFPLLRADGDQSASLPGGC